jgi:hypothetical protein
LKRGCWETNIIGGGRCKKNNILEEISPLHPQKVMGEK